MTEINEGGPYKVKVKSPYTFTLGIDSTKFGTYTTGGFCNEKKVPFKVSFKTLETSLQ